MTRGYKNIAIKEDLHVALKVASCAMGISLAEFISLLFREFTRQTCKKEDGHERK